MGWSCTKKAGEVLDAMARVCQASTGMTNTWDSKGKRYFWETGREHYDGHITGQIYREDEQGFVRPSGSFSIEANGRIERMPASLRRLVEREIKKSSKMIGIGIGRILHKIGGES